MSKYTVNVRRTEIITFEVEAEDEVMAEENYLMDGDEVFSTTNETTVLSVRACK